MRAFVVIHFCDKMSNAFSSLGYILVVIEVNFFLLECADESFSIPVLPRTPATCYRNLNTHKPASLYKAFDPDEAKRIAEKLEFHYTPKHGSWLNIAEIELSVLSRQCLSRRIPDQETLKREIQAWQNQRNQLRATVQWHFTTKDARIKLKRLYPSSNE